MKTLVIVDHNNVDLNKSTLSTITAAKKIGSVDLLIIGNECKSVSLAASKIDGIENIYINENECYKNFLSENISEFIMKFSSNGLIKTLPSLVLMVASVSPTESTEISNMSLSVHTVWFRG